MDIDPSETVHFLLGKLSCFCMVLAEGKGLELGVGIEACMLERELLLGGVGVGESKNPTKNLHILGDWRNTVTSDFVRNFTSDTGKLTFPL